MYNQNNMNPQMMPGGPMPINRGMMPQGPVGMQYDSTYYGNYPNPQQQQAPPHHSQYIQQTMPQQQPQMPRDESLVKLKRLDEINANIAKISNLLIQFFDELIKDKQPSTKIKQTKIVFEEFLKHLKKVETDLLHEISLLSMASTGHQHEGSIYGARKDFDLGKMQLNLIATQLNSLKESLTLPLKLEEDQTSDESSEE